MHRLAVLLVLAVTIPAQRSAESPVKVPEGFRATRLYSVPKAQGSWVSLANVDKGRLVACNQYGKLFRITLPKKTGGELVVEELKTDVGEAQGLLYAFGSLYVMGKQTIPAPQVEPAKKPKKGKKGKKGKKAKPRKVSGLFRLTDTTGDDQFDKVEHLLKVPVGGEHHAHAIVLSPDGNSLYICAGNMSRIPKPDFTSSRMPRIWKGDHILPRMPDARGHNTGAASIGGWVARLSPDGSERELISNGYRNHYDIAFSPRGELFTYDSDMEYDIGAAWYRPTRVCHVVSGSEFGWRYGTGKWPAYYADSLGSVVDIGPGSPTGITFGTGAKFPARYQKALFIADWSYGVIYAVHLTPKGASFSGMKEAFATSTPFAVTDMVVRRDDGALYFAVGGRGSRSALYRIDYVGSESTSDAGVAAVPAASAKLHKLRRRLETMHAPGAPDVVRVAWPYLGHSDRHIRFAARIAVENQPLDTWSGKVFDESDPRAVVHGVIALTRHGKPELQASLLHKLVSVPWKGRSSEEKLELLRAYDLVFARMGMRKGVSDAVRSARAKVVEVLDVAYPDGHRKVNMELCRTLSFLNAPSVIGKSLKLLAAAPSQEEQMHYAYCLRVVKNGWTKTTRTTYLQWFHQAAGYRGGSSFLGFCKNIRKDAISSIPKAERKELGELVTKEIKPTAVEAVPKARSFVKAWTVAELESTVSKKKKGHDFARGRRLFGEAACIRCHRFAGEGGAVGPDLTSVRGRFGIREILESIIKPSEVISDQYQPTIFELENGDIAVGYVANLNRNTVKIVEDMYKPGNLRALKVEDIKSQKPSPVSMMPAGLLSTLAAKEVQDLMAYMLSGGNPDHALYK